MRVIVVSAALVLALAACSEGASASATSAPPRDDANEASVSAGDRVLGIDITEGDVGFGAAFAIAERTGARLTGFPLFWDETETAPFVFEPEESYPAILDAFYAPKGWSVVLTLAVVDTVTDRRPPDLRDLPFDDPRVLDRFEALVEWTAGQVPNLRISAIAIGNEADVILEMTGRWDEYERFLDRAVPMVRAAFPGVPVGVTMTFDGLTGEASDRAIALLRSADTALVTYYPLDGSFRVRDPAEVGSDIDELLAAVDPLNVQITEAGYPTGDANGSSESAQAQFVSEVFAAWDRQADRIPTLTFTWLHDIGPEAVATFGTYYGVGDERFASYLGTLGLRTADGENKEGFEALLAEATKRGFGDGR